MLPSPLIGIPAESILYGEIALAALLLVLVLLKPGIVRTLEGKVLLLLSLFLAPAIAAYGGVTEHVERSRTTGYCLSCHVMSDYGKSLRADDPASIPASHYRNNLVPRDHACISCHMGYGLSGDHRAIARFARSAARTYFGAAPEKIRLARRYKNRDCLRCHVNARSFEQSPSHQEGAGPLVSLASIKAGKVSCTRSGCHDLVHDVRELAAADPAAVPGAPAGGVPPGLVPGAAPGVPGAAPKTAPADTARPFPPLPGPSPRSGS